MNIRIYDHSYHEVISGGDVIAAEFTKYWELQGHSVLLSTHPEAAAFFRTRSVPEHSLHIATRIRTGHRSVLIGSIAHIINAVADALITRKPGADIIFAGSWSLQDLLPALIDKYKTPRAQLVVGCYLLLAPPWSGTYGSNWINRLVFWSEYVIGITLTRLHAAVIWTASPADALFIQTHWHKQAAAIRGGADIQAARAAVTRVKKKRYDAVYIGRFHPQKNIDELIDIWKLVVLHKHDATLVIAGAGFLKHTLETKIRSGNLQHNVTLLPQIDGEKKFDLLAASRLFISASHHDTGNLALDEALACGTPGIVYDLPKLDYPRGVLHVVPFNTAQFTRMITTVLDEEKIRNNLSDEAHDFSGYLDWHTQSKRALDTIPLSP